MDASYPKIPVIDLFAGPGGLGEGFAACQINGQDIYKHVLSIEKDKYAHKTLKLRAFFRKFPKGEVPEDYYRFLREQITLDELYTLHQPEADQAAHEAWCMELGKEAVTHVRKRIKQSLSNTDPWVLLGGPPCQPFSLAGRSRNRKGTQYSPDKETRHQLYIEYLQIIADFWPTVFVMENVRGLMSAKFSGQRMFDRIRIDLQDPAKAIYRIPGRGCRKGQKQHTYRLYPVAPDDGKTGDGLFHDDKNLTDYMVRCENYGVPQARHRLILLGIRDDLDNRKPNPVKKKPQITVSQVINDLPALRSGLSRQDNREDWLNQIKQIASSKWLKNLGTSEPRIRRVIDHTLKQIECPKYSRGSQFCEKDITGACQLPDEYQRWYFDPKIKGLCNHQARGHMPSDLHRYLFAACFAKVHQRSPSLNDFPTELLPNHKSVNDALKGGHFADRFRVQVESKPSTTIVSHISKDGHYYIHPDPKQCRSLTVREAARLQTFPDNYFFIGNRTQQYTQVGNAVPPFLARQIAKLVHDLLQSAEKI